jgi:hypothetical protein
MAGSDPHPETARGKRGDNSLTEKTGSAENRHMTMHRHRLSA